MKAGPGRSRAVRAHQLPQRVLPERCRERLPSLAGKRQRRTVAVGGVADQDRAGDGPGLDAVRAVAAVAGLAPARVYLLHLSTASMRMSRLPARLSASARTLLKVDDARLTTSGLLVSWSSTRLSTSS